MRAASPWPQAETVIRALADELAALGVRVLDARACSRVGLLVSANRIVWCYGRRLHWQQDGQAVTWPTADTYGAARRLTGSGPGGRPRT
jgi:hypothetical protein